MSLRSLKMSKDIEEKNRKEADNFKKKAFKVINTEESIQTKIIKLLDKQLQILDDEVNLLKFKITHKKVGDEELEIIYESLKRDLNLED
jgi:hypothetical protein